MTLPDLGEMIIGLKTEPDISTYIEIVSRKDREKPVDYKTTENKPRNGFVLKKIDGESQEDYQKRSYEWEKTKRRRMIRNGFLLSVGIMISSSYLLMREYMPQYNTLLQEVKQSLVCSATQETETIEDYVLPPIISEQEKFESIFNHIE